MENMKLGVWEYFVYLMSGFTVLAIIVCQCLLKGFITIECLLGAPSAVMVTSLLFGLMLIGMLMEPLSNIVFKAITTKRGELRSELSFKLWDEKIMTMETEASKHAPDGFTLNVFPYAKNWVLLNGGHTEYHSYLSKYGFYRSMAFAFLINAAISLVLHWFLLGLILCIINALFSALYTYRAGVFYRHMSVSVYNQFILGCINTGSKE